MKWFPSCELVLKGWQTYAQIHTVKRVEENMLLGWCSSQSLFVGSSPSDFQTIDVPWHSSSLLFYYPWAIFFPVIGFNYLPMLVSLDISIQSDGSFHSLHSLLIYYTDISYSSQKQFTQDKMYHLSFSSFCVTYLKKKKKISRYSVVLARNLGTSQAPRLSLSFSIHSVCPGSLPL